MFYGGINADFTNNNWFGNQIDVDTQMGRRVSGDFTGSWFDGAPPTAAQRQRTITFNTPSARRRADAPARAP